MKSKMKSDFAHAHSEENNVNSEFRRASEMNSDFADVLELATNSPSNAYGLQKNEATLSASALREMLLIFFKMTMLQNLAEFAESRKHFTKNFRDFPKMQQFSNLADG